MWLHNNPGRLIRLRQVAKLFCGAYRKAATLGNIISGFEKSGIFPLNRDVFPHWMFLASSVTDLPNPDHSGEVVANKANSSENIPTPRSNQEIPRPSGKSNKTISAKKNIYCSFV